MKFIVIASLFILELAFAQDDCPNNFYPLCGSDGVQYNNLCLAARANAVRNI